MPWFDVLRRPKHCVGLEFGGDYLSVAVSTLAERRLRHVSVLRADTAPTELSQWTPRLKAFVEKHQLKAQYCSVVMNVADYQLLLVEAPDVPDEEMREAVRWRIKDLINVPVEAAVVDVFPVPSDASRAGKKMLYVVVATREWITRVIDLVRAADLQLRAIDIEVLALRNLTLNLAAERGLALVRLRPGVGDVSIFKQGNLYLTRHFKLNYSGGLLDDLPDEALALEVQRSFDYVERQMGQVPPSQVYVCGEGLGAEKITDSLRKAMPAQVAYFDLADHLQFAQEPADEGIAQLCVAAAGGALREEVA